MKRITFACEDAQGLDGLMSGHFGLLSLLHPGGC